MKFLAVLLALAAAVLVAYGVALIYLPAGFVISGLELACAAYMAADYATAKGGPE